MIAAGLKMGALRELVDLVNESLRSGALQEGVEADKRLFWAAESPSPR